MDCCLTNDDAFVVGGSEDGYVFFWELVDAPVVARFRAHSSVVFFFPELHLQLLIVYWSSLVSFFSVVYSHYCMLRCSFWQVTSISYHPTKACMLTSSVDGSIRVWA